MIERKCAGIEREADPSGATVLVSAFAVSVYAQERYEHWPLGRRVHAFLAEQAGIEDYESVFMAVYSKAIAESRDKIVAAV